MAPVESRADPALPSSCARAATAAEARHRIQRPIAPARAPRVVALDDGAVEVVRRMARLPWANAQFYACEAGGEAVVLRRIEGRPAGLADELVAADVVVMIATDDRGAGGAHAIGTACGQRGIMTAGLVVAGPDAGADTHAADRAVAALRPHARVLLPGADENDVVELLRALRA
jgi:hypothetical protein